MLLSSYYHLISLIIESVKSTNTPKHWVLKKSINSHNPQINIPFIPLLFSYCSHTILILLSCYSSHTIPNILTHHSKPTSIHLVIAMARLARSLDQSSYYHLLSPYNYLAVILPSSYSHLNIHIIVILPSSYSHLYIHIIVIIS